MSSTDNVNVKGDSSYDGGGGGGVKENDVEVRLDHTINRDKLESSRITHQYIRSLGLDEKEIENSFEIITKDDGSVDKIWKQS